MSKSNFNALVQAKKQRDSEPNEPKISGQTTKLEEESQREEKSSEKLEKNKSESKTPTYTLNAHEPKQRKNKRETVRRSYRVEETHDKAIKIISKFMGQGTEEEIVLDIFAYYFENNPNGKKALQMVSLLDN